MKSGMPRTIGVFVLKAIVSIALIAWALRSVDISAMRAQLANADPLIVLIAIALTTGISVIHAERWRIVLERLGFALRFGRAWRLVLIGYFFNQTLPSTMGGDAFKAWGAYRHGVGVRPAIASVIIDRIVALASLLLMVLIGLPWLFEIISAPSARWAVTGTLAGGVLGMALLLALGRFSSKLERWHGGRLLIQVADGTRAMFARTGALLRVISLTVLALATASYVVHLLARGLAIPLDLGDALLLVPWVALVMVLPISIAGWGLRESAMIVALGLIGIPAAAAFSLSVLSGLVAMASGVPGGVAWLVTRESAPGSNERSSR